MFEQGMLLLVGEAFLETLFMTLVSTFFAYVIGLPLGMLLVVSDKEIGRAHVRRHRKRIGRRSKGSTANI